MRRRLAAWLAAALLVGGAAFAAEAVPGPTLAQSGAGAANVTSGPSFDVRLSIAENRITVLERDRDRLLVVPQQLTRIETRLDALQEQTKGWSGNVTTIVIGLFMMIMSAVVGAAIQSKRGPPVKPA